ncbi:MAG: SAM-dependent methyltransferase [Candidatus Daviesbacteria bacterium]|nr:SAM-dependent methyltransferase [Candidatus Daviesbacteria bacterium]
MKDQDSSAMPQNDKNHQFVSRGGIKLQAAIENFKLKIANLTALDVGSSTGGFVDCLLQNGAGKVYSVDTCYGELAWKLRNDPKVVVMERTNILHLDHLPERVIARSPPAGGRRSNLVWVNKIATLPLVARNDKEQLDLITIDAGWTKLELVLPVVKKFLKPNGIIIALLKPQYEADKKDLRKGILLPEKAEEVKDQVLGRIKNLKFKIKNYIESPILGGGGNKEFLIYFSSLLI